MKHAKSKEARKIESTEVGSKDSMKKGARKLGSYESRNQGGTSAMKRGSKYAKKAWKQERKQVCK